MTLQKQRRGREAKAVLLAAAMAAMGGVLRWSSPASALTINLTFDPTVTSLPNNAQVQSAMNYTAQQLQNLYSDPVSINVTVASSTSGLGGSNTSILGTLTYAQNRSAMSADSTSADDATALANIPVTSPLPASSVMVYTRAQAKALSLIASDATTDGTFTFNHNFSFTFDPANRAAPGLVDFIGVAEHELTEIMGRIPSLGHNFFGQPDYLPYDLFRWTGPGARNLSDAAGAYFSIDGGTTNLRGYNFANGNGSDPQDWDAAFPDSFNAFGGSPNVMDPITPVDVTVMDVIGYNLQSLTWDGQGNGTTWDIFNTSNWHSASPGKTYTDAARVLFDDTNINGNSIVLNQVVYPTSVTVNSSINNYTISGSGAIAGSASLIKSGNSTLTISNVNTYTGTTTVQAGRLLLAANLTRTSAVTVQSGATLELQTGSGALLRTPLLTVNGTGIVNLQDNKLITATPAGTWNGVSYTGITGLVAQGRNGNTLPLWDGTGIVTGQLAATTSNFTAIGVAKASDARPATATATALWAGQTITGSDTLVMYTYGGDANLDGKINVDDYIRIDTGIAGGLTGWSNGDFNYDGKINIDDYTQFIDANIGTQGAPFSTSGGVLASGFSEPGVAGSGSAIAYSQFSQAGGPVSAIPEPAIVPTLMAGSLGIHLLRRRRAVQPVHS